MRVDFLYNPQLDVVGHTQHISIHATFGEAIDSFCAHVGIREQDWIFAWAPTPDMIVSLTHKRTTPHQLAYTDNDSVDIFCVPKSANN